MNIKRNIIFTAQHNKNQTFEIVKDSKAGYYLFAYENGKCIWDDLQDTLYWAQQSAKEKFGVPESAWQKVG